MKKFNVEEIHNSYQKGKNIEELCQNPKSEYGIKYDFLKEKVSKLCYIVDEYLNKTGLLIGLYGLPIGLLQSNSSNVKQFDETRIKDKIGDLSHQIKDKIGTTCCS